LICRRAGGDLLTLRHKMGGGRKEKEKGVQGEKNPQERGGKGASEHLGKAHHASDQSGAEKGLTHKTWKKGDYKKNLGARGRKEKRGGGGGVSREEGKKPMTV